MKSAETKPRPDGRKAFLTYLNPAVVLALKQAALEQDQPAYLIVEKLLVDHLGGAKTPKG